MLAGADVPRLVVESVELEASASVAVPARCYPAHPADWEGSATHALGMAATPGQDDRDAPDGSEDKSPVGELWGVRSRREGAANCDRDDQEPIRHSRDQLDARDQGGSDQDDRVDREVCCQDARHHFHVKERHYNTIYLHVLMPFYFWVMG